MTQGFNENKQKEELADITELTKEENSDALSLKEVLRELMIYALIVIVCVSVVPKYVIQRTIITGRSMERSLQDGDNVLVEKLFFRLSDPERFDIVMFYPFGVEEEDYYVKRVIALPGETIQIIGDDIYIDGELLEENYGKQAITYQGIAEEPITLGSDEYFLMGDNRKVSFDSRYEEIGPVKRELIAGKALVRIWPFEKIGGID